MATFKNLKQLKDQCVLIASFKESSFVVFDDLPANFYEDPNTAFLFYDNHGVYYLYLHILDSRILQFSDRDTAIKRFSNFVHCMLSR